MFYYFVINICSMNIIIGSKKQMVVRYYWYLIFYVQNKTTSITSMSSLIVGWWHHCVLLAEVFNLDIKATTYEKSTIAIDSCLSVLKKILWPLVLYSSPACAYQFRILHPISKWRVEPLFACKNIFLFLLWIVDCFN